ncbi:MAG: hypothetical protein FWD34_08910 [Oscillospiraceae bacterium]|nr:hypothetical protein [Oscillospiraceae bacterium]
MSIFKNNAFEALTELGIDPYDTAFIKAKPLSVYFRTRIKKSNTADDLLSALLHKNAKLFICPLTFHNGLYAFAPPEAIYAEGYTPKKTHIPPRRLKKKIAVLNKKLLCVNNEFMRKVMAGAKKNAEFVERFNSELFYKNITLNNERISPEEMFKLLSTEPYYRRINLSSDKDKNPFISMYAIAFKECQPHELFTIEGIFSMQTDRHIDNSKKQAANEVFNLILMDDKEETDSVILKMGKAIEEIEPLKINLDDVNMLAKNYTMFIGLSELGRVMAEVFFYNGNRELDGALRKAEELKNYAKTAALCERLMRLTDCEDYRQLPQYKQAENPDNIGLSPYVKLRNS